MPKMIKLLVVLLVLVTSGPVVAEGFGASSDDRLVQQGRILLAREHPDVMRHMARQDGFGGPSSPVIARAMLSDAPELVAAARAKMTIDTVGQGLWLIRFPYVNVALIETRNGLVLFDSGYAAIGPVLVETIPTLSRKPLTHIIVSHVHIDHAYGWPALKRRWPKAKTVTSADFLEMAAKEVQLAGSIGRYNNQKLDLQPTSLDRLPSPDILVGKETKLMIDGERFVLFHAPGETEEQLWMALPGRKAIFTADYFQGFVPNAGNGKRIMRHIDEWAAALRLMVAQRSVMMLPMHGPALKGEGQISEALTLQADALQHISNSTVARLNAGERKDVIAATTDWPERFAAAPGLNAQYNRPSDITRMVALRWTGWWDDIPSHFAAMRFEEEAREAVRLAGGVDAVDKRARELLPANPKLATRLADWAFFGAPDDVKALTLSIDIYMARLAEPDMPVQEGLVYFDQAARARAKLEQIRGSKSAGTQ
jgi:glyoxylase-like metal-dependent hydrolase (beta-lactamase superfamily II)